MLSAIRPHPRRVLLTNKAREGRVIKPIVIETWYKMKKYRILKR
jgi:hypothetical protein